jgi:ribosomal protein S18 acetylase RimI-like enzyme
MIQKLKHTNPNVAKEIRAVFQVSYAVEADLLKAVDFPPLKRSLANFLRSQTDFYGYFHANELAAVIEIKSQKDNTHLQSLVVDPFFFRKGIGQKLVHFAFETYHTPKFSVETGLANLPATSLYKKLGFIETKQWDTDHGVRKVRFEKMD